MTTSTVLSGGFEALNDHLVGTGGAVGVGGVELHRLHAGNRLAECPGGLLEPAGVAPGEDGGPAAVDGQQPDDLAGDVRGPTEDDHRLWMPEGVVHRGDPETAGEVGREDTLGIDATAGGDQVARAGGTWPGAAPAAGERPWPGRRGRRRRRLRPSRRSSSPGSADGPTGKSRARVHPSWAKESGPGVPGPKRFSTARNDGTPGRCDPLHGVVDDIAPSRVGRRTGTARSRPGRRAGSSDPRRRAGGRRRPRGAGPGDVEEARNQASFNARTESRLASRRGAASRDTGTGARPGTSRLRRRRRSGSAPEGAWSPRVSTERWSPPRWPRQSSQATL